MSSLWMPGALVVPGNPDKVGYDALGFGVKGPKRGDVKHSAEGWAAYLKFLVQSSLAIKSWHFSVLTDGTKWQHYPINVHCWHAGDTDDDHDVRANIELVGIEHEGLVGTPLTAEQTQATIEISRFCAGVFERTAAYARFPVQPADGWTLVEHTEVSNTFTACPSGRIPWEDVLERLTPQNVDLLEDQMPAFVKLSADDDDDDPGRVWIITANTKRKLYGTRPDLAQQLGIPQIVTVIQQKTLDSLIEVG